MKETVAAKIDGGKVVEVIVGEASWAVENLGGEWVQVEADYDNPESLPGIGDSYGPDGFTRSNLISETLAARESAVSKLASVGLTADEVKALLT